MEQALSEIMATASRLLLKRTGLQLGIGSLTSGLLLDWAIAVLELYQH